MEEKLNYLRGFIYSNNKQIRIVSFDEIKKIDSNLLPKEWIKIFSERESTNRVNMILNMWERYSKNNLPLTIRYLKDNLQDVELLDINGHYTVLYTVRSTENQEKIYYYEGGNPLDEINNEELERAWDKIPILVREFYKKLHNGFCYYASKSMGLVSLNYVNFFGDDEWGIIEDLREPIQINLQTTFGFFKSGMGGYIAIDYENCKNDNATLWFSDDQPDYNINFWDYVDQWIVIGLEE